MIETASATELQNSFGRYLNMVMGGDEVIITRNGKEVARLIPKKQTVSFLTDSLTGILQGYLDQNEVSDVARMEALREKYEISD